MSFAHKVKEELIEYDKAAREAGNETPESLHAERYGLFLFCRNFSMQNMCLKTEMKSIAQMYVNAVYEMTGKRAEQQKSQAGKYRVSVPTAEARLKIMESFGYSGKEVTRRLNRANLDDETCNAALLRGAFLACGTMTDPEKDYHIEFILSHKVLCTDLMKLLSEENLEPKYVLRNGAHVVYFKESESVEDLLTLMGATESSLELMGTKMYKDVRNRVNRRMNFENANSSRTFNAAYREVEAIRLIEAEKGLGYLPNDLRELAKLRMENVDYSLQELADNLTEPLSKSGVNHRMKRILELAEDLELAKKRSKPPEKEVP